MKKYRPVRAHFDFWGYKPCVLLCMALAAGIFAKAQSVTCTPSRIAFATSVATGHTSASQNFTVEVANLSGSAITLQPSSQVQVSLEDTDKAYVRTPITIAADELAKGKPVYVRFAPTCNGFSDSVVSSSIIFLSQRNELLGSVAVTGAVRQEGAGGGQPFKVATFNAEWLGCPSNGPDDKTLQMRNVATVISEMDADIVALQEVANNPIQSIDTVLAHLGSAWGGHIVPHNPSSCAQSEAVIYKKSRATLTGTPYLLSNAGSASAWSSGRYPVEFSFNISADNRTIPITLVNLHAKAFSDTTSYSRRVQASLGLKTLLDGSSYSTQNLIVLGDFNDDIDASTYKKLASPYKNFVDDSLHYRFLTSAISASVSMIDHIMVSNELFPYVYGNAQREDDIVNDVSDYTATTSDHLPVSATLAFGKVGHDLPVPD
ncbi:MAG: endonuclease/exonuclease/phosphatase family protein, partial [Prevotellaceae bacterium]|nr:endonuclease/exonuclease/phosphatase family protein [Prevotellaceae bacterium]